MRIIRRNANERRTPARRLSRIFASGVIAFSILNVYVNHLAFQYQLSGDLSVQEEQRQNSFVMKGLRRLVHNHHLLFNQTLLVKQFRYDEVDEEQRVAYNTKMEQTKRRNISNERRPSIVWLMSYPNSGTSFTMSMTFKDSNHTVAVNYPAEPKNFGHPLESLYDSSAVPFLLHPNLTLPTKYILTKTHCTGYCTHCPPHRYFNLTKEFFYEKCASVTDHKDEGHYSDFAKSRVEKAVHLFRDPVDNVVSNYHLLLKQFKRKGNNKLLGYFSNDRAGFRKFCEVQDTKWIHKEKQKHGRNFKQMNDVPCHAMFYKWTQWHNLAFETTTQLNIPFLPIWYEDYGTDFSSTKGKLFDFLELESIREAWPFNDGKTYRNFFTKEERTRILRMIRFFAKDEVWALAKRYAE